MEVILFFFVGIVAFSILLVVAEPHKYLPEGKAKIKKVGSSYWGVYDGSAVNSPTELCTIEIKKATRKDKVVAGSQTYAAGRGVNMSGR
ncbi:MAG TPA: hypothetical protein V6C76_14500 [Drouetiella sp.]